MVELIRGREFSNGKLDELGCIAAPIIIIEITPVNNKEDLIHKTLDNPSFRTKTCTLINSKYTPLDFLASSNIIEAQCLPGFILDLDYVFKDLI